MRKLSLIVVLICGLLAACAGAPEAPTPDPDADTSITGDSANGDTIANDGETPEAIVIVTRDPNTPPPFEDVEIPPPGTLVASETEDPAAGTPFDRIRLVRTSGEDSAIDLELVLMQDGTFTRDGVEGRITAEEVARIQDQLEELNFFGLQANMLGPSAEDIAIRYRVTVTRGGQSRTIQSQDQYMPQEYIRFLAALVDIGFRN